MSGQPPFSAPSSTDNPVLMPPFFHSDFSLNAGRQSTPPPGESPHPRTPKSRRFIEPPKTPMGNAHSSFGGDGYFEPLDGSMLHAGMAIKRPSSSCSNYSCSSDSSVDSNTTYRTDGGSCTSIEDEDGTGAYTKPNTVAYRPEEIGTYIPADNNNNSAYRPNESDYVHSTAAQRHPTHSPAPADKGKHRSRKRQGRARKTQWSEAMDAHLWRTYTLYQQDPKITPFFVLPGQVPPLGVCYKVARETKRSWVESKLSGEYTPAPTPRSSRLRSVTPASDAVGNRGDALRKTTPYTWTASESSTRRRLRELCRDSYGPRNPIHNHHQQRSGPARRDPFSTTRSMALSLTTSTATSMRPSGALAALAAGRELHTPRPEYRFAGIAERIASSEAGIDIASVFRGSKRDRELSPEPPSHRRQISLDAGLLPALELKTSSRTSHGTWPRRPTIPDESSPPEDVIEEVDEPVSAPPLHRRRRGTLCDEDEQQVKAPPAEQNVKRARGHAATAAAPQPRRRVTRAAAVAAAGEEAAAAAAARLASPFFERGREE